MGVLLTLQHTLVWDLLIDAHKSGAVVTKRLVVTPRLAAVVGAALHTQARPQVTQGHRVFIFGGVIARDFAVHAHVSISAAAKAQVAV